VEAVFIAVAFGALVLVGTIAFLARWVTFVWCAFKWVVGLGVGVGIADT
jgi:hypothetical protein